MAMRRLLIVSLALLLLGAAAVFLYAAPRGDDGQAAGTMNIFQRFDANGDGQVDRDEFQGPDNAFARLDANGDGVITPDEVGGRQAQGTRPRGRRMMDPEQRWQQMLERFDENNDGQISADEFKGPERVFTMLDQDGDGLITQAEATRFRGLGRPDRDWGNRAAGLEMMLRRCDEDGDGRVTRDEWPGRDEMFDRLDADGDGFITAEDVAAIRQQPRPQRMNPAQILLRVLDKNGDGQVSNSEWTDFFASADTDGDELLSYEELFTQLQKALRPPVQEPAEE